MMRTTSYTNTITYRTMRRVMVVISCTVDCATPLFSFCIQMGNRDATSRPEYAVTREGEPTPYIEQAKILNIQL